MLDQTFDPLEAERLELINSNKNAQQRVWEAHGTEPPLEDLAIFFDNLPGNVVLDVGCGWGYYVHRFLSRNLNYRGIDLSPEMIRLSRESNPGTWFEVMSYRKLDFPADMFDGLWCSCIFGGEPKYNMPTVLTELKRVLKPGGIMTVVMPVVWRGEDELICDAEGNAVNWSAYYEPGELHRLVERVGFSEVTPYDRYYHGAATVMARK